MRKIKKETIEKCLAVLKEMKYMADNKLKMDAKGIAAKYHTSQAVPMSAKRVGFFTTQYSGFWICKKQYFDPADARILLNDIYNTYKRKDKVKIKNENDIHPYLPGEREKLDEDQRLFFEKHNIVDSPKIRNENIIPPLLKDVEKYCNERKNDINPEKWYAYYESKNWMIGKAKMKNWKAAIHTWEHQNYNNISSKKLSDYSDQELIDELKRRGYSGLLEIKREVSF